MAATEITSYELSEESRKVIRDILNSKCEDGVLELRELGECLEAFGLDADDEDIDFLSKHLDDNGDGSLEVDELLENIDVINFHCFYGKELMSEFLLIDQDRDGIIRFPEMLRFLTTHEPDPLTPKEGGVLLDKLARKYDANFDGKFSYTEFVKIYMSDELPFKNQLEKGQIKIVEIDTSDPKAAAVKKKKKLLKKKSSNALIETPSKTTTVTMQAPPPNPGRPLKVWERLAEPKPKPANVNIKPVKSKSSKTKLR